jgi:hypothetical protein
MTLDNITQKSLQKINLFLPAHLTACVIAVAGHIIPGCRFVPTLGYQALHS